MKLFDGTFQLYGETERAICVSEDGGKNRKWLPKSQIEYTVLASKEVEVTMPAWLAADKGFAGA